MTMKPRHLSLMISVREEAFWSLFISTQFINDFFDSLAELTVLWHEAAKECARNEFPVPGSSRKRTQSRPTPTSPWGWQPWCVKRNAIEMRRLQKVRKRQKGSPSMSLNNSTCRWFCSVFPLSHNRETRFSKGWFLLLHTAYLESIGKSRFHARGKRMV